ncbi:DUF3854 domain-containing protein [Actinomycetospora cinnamomea]|uniref:Uncharacterized protein DUF3854 n=1 Tax=Actinomycetospora cinnamomea TaxID=663609 RepID=A0A2U1FA38_9PSEU|nr:DUF3854 domain-containing protein [Actinomycetospora cinnamomea]PVZ09057.1 uncharacterized protein DUF3854 [Actinomycetospora cinnamomea]
MTPTSYGGPGREAAPVSGFSDAARQYLADRAVDEESAPSLGIEPVADVTDLPEGLGNYPTPGFTARWDDPHGEEPPVIQYHADEPGDFPKYGFVRGEGPGLGLVREATGRPRLIAIVEGTSQARALARYAPDDVTVLAIPGCWGWSHEGTPTPRLRYVKGHDVLVILDGDAASNLDVYEAGMALAAALRSYGAASVYFPRLPVSGKCGVDDYLASIPEGDRG